eukprot:CAMPEP_0170549640 /NCGR_PEP_ID=MMETSP0211-20121228/7794_1 /TAXON_ID=311385 /ORGANISM="Pseudokeronopsis sp., Strain OXSARD2" /LENGTH=315 /DNA_ID=CAMNT_0010855783 /DNA_START=304 /DNA_END=1252 /DNA_ORIENTATION=+
MSADPQESKVQQRIFIHAVVLQVAVEVVSRGVHEERHFEGLDAFFVQREGDYGVGAVGLAERDDSSDIEADESAGDTEVVDGIGGHEFVVGGVQDEEVVDEVEHVDRPQDQLQLQTHRELLLDHPLHVYYEDEGDLDDHLGVHHEVEGHVDVLVVLLVALEALLDGEAGEEVRDLVQVHRSHRDRYQGQQDQNEPFYDVALSHAVQGTNPSECEHTLLLLQSKMFIVSLEDEMDSEGSEEVGDDEEGETDAILDLGDGAAGCDGGGNRVLLRGRLQESRLKHKKAPSVITLRRIIISFAAELLGVVEGFVEEHQE